MSEFRRNAFRWSVSAVLAAGMLLSSTLPVLAGPGDVNSVNDGQIIQNGTYYNTPGSQTVFQNSAGTGLHLRAGDLVTGREVSNAANPLGSLTGNGGSLLFNSPGQVVRLDGNINVSGFVNGAGVLGNGGNVTVNSAFLYQNGQIFANGANGGQVQFNVGSMTMGQNAAIYAQGATGDGGRVVMNATGAVDIARGAIVDTSGEIIGTYNTNVIHIEGGLVNLDGILNANGQVPGQRGGIVNVVAKGNSTAINGTALANATGVISDTERSDLTSRDSQLRASANGDVRVGADGRISANGANGTVGDGAAAEDGGHGGLVEIYAARHVVNDGVISANGGDGGSNTAIASGPVTHYVDPIGREGYMDSHGNEVYKVSDKYGNVSYEDWDGNPATVAGSLVPLNIQVSVGQDGGRGGDAGAVLVRYGTSVRNASIINNGSIEVRGGNGGDGQQAISNAVIDGPHYFQAFGGRGGDAGYGGFVEMVGGVGANLPSQNTLNNIDVSGGQGGSGGAAAIGADCGCAHPGADGGCGGPGQIQYRVSSTPPPPPETPPDAPYPREYPRLGEALPPGLGPVLSYNRSIFLARAPVPVIQKKKPKPAYRQIVGVPSAPPPPAPPPQRRSAVRGYW